MPAFPSPAELVEAIPVILSLVVIEGLLSVDNSLAIAAMARQVPAERRSAVLWWGMFGAYFFRCICLLMAAWIITNPWIKLFGAAYLVWLMCRELTHAGKDEDESGAEPGARSMAGRSFASVVMGILLLDASLSVDNVIAAIAMTPKLWAVYVGVGIGILALRLLAGWAIRLIEKHPILEKTAFLLVGFVGIILLVELWTHTHLAPFYKFLGICVIIGISLLYAENESVRTALRPLVKGSYWPMRAIAQSIGWLLWPIFASARWAKGLFRGKESATTT